MELHPDHRTPAILVEPQISPQTSRDGMTPSTWAPGTPTSRLLLTQISLPLLALLGTAMRECGMTRGTQGTGVEVLLEKEAPGVVQVGLIQVPHLGTHMTSSRLGGTSLNSLLGVKGSPHFLHACRDLPISEDPSLPTSSHLLSTSHHHHHTILDASLHASCRRNLPRDTTTIDRHTPRIALTMLRGNFPETCQALPPTTIPIRGYLHQVWELIILPGVEASTRILARLRMALMVIHHTCVIGSIRFKMTPVWCPMCPTLTCQLV